MRLRPSHIAILLVACAGAGSANCAERWLGASAGTFGPQIEAGMRFDERWGVRASANTAAFSFTYHDKEALVHSRMRMLGLGVTADYYPQESGFHLSGGVRFSADRISGHLTDLERRMSLFGGKTTVVIPDPLTRFTLKPNAIQPYLGVGYEQKLTGAVSLNLDFGALYTGRPKLDVDSDATLLGFTEEQIDREIERARERLSPFRVFPVAQIGLRVHF